METNKAPSHGLEPVDIELTAEIEPGKVKHTISVPEQTNTGERLWFRSSLMNVDLSGETDLLSRSFAQSDLTGAKLPEHLSFDEALASIADAGKQAKTAFLALLVTSLYCVVSAGKTDALALAADTVRFELAIINDEVAIAGFYFVAPLLLLIIFLWMNSYLQRAWSLIALLPRKFPDGMDAVEHLSQWLPLALFSRNNRAQDSRGSTSRFPLLEFLLCIIAVWAVAPVTIAVLFFAYLPRHDVIVSSVLGMSFSIVVGCLVFFAKQAHFAFQDPYGLKGVRSGKFLSPVMTFVLSASFSSIFILISVAGYNANQTPNFLLQALGKYPDPNHLTTDKEFFFDLKLPDSSAIIKRPADWTVDLLDTWNIDVSEADLQKKIDDLPIWNANDRNLDRGKFNRMFLPRSQFRRSKLRQFSAHSTVLVSSDFSHAQMRGSTFYNSDLRLSNFVNSDLRNVDFTRADLRGANFNCANLKGAIFKEARISGATFDKVIGCSLEEELSLEEFKDLLDSAIYSKDCPIIKISSSFEFNCTS